MMEPQWANEYAEIPEALSTNPEIRKRLITLISTRAIVGKVTEGGVRVELLRAILTKLANGEITEIGAFKLTEAQLSPITSPYADNARVFCRDWAERLVKTQFSRFYNQAVMNYASDHNDSYVMVPHSSKEDVDSQCSQILAGKTHSIEMLLSRLIKSYEEGNWSNEAKIPDHPHCTHVVQPLAKHDSLVITA